MSKTINISQTTDDGHNIIGKKVVLRTDSSSEVKTTQEKKCL